ncbi:MAG: hypothetical protein ACEPO2_19095 [Pelagibaca sp.]
MALSVLSLPCMRWCEYVRLDVDQIWAQHLTESQGFLDSLALGKWTNAMFEGECGRCDILKTGRQVSLDPRQKENAGVKEGDEARCSPC